MWSVSLLPSVHTICVYLNERVNFVAPCIFKTVMIIVVIFIKMYDVYLSFILQSIKERERKDRNTSPDNS